MKYRNGFISNSSSSSFICNFCGREESGYDLGLSDAEMCECENGHIFCESEILKLPNETYNIDDYNHYDDRYDVPERFCPVCNRAKEMSKDDDYKEYKRLFEKFKGIKPDGCL